MQEGPAAGLVVSSTTARAGAFELGPIDLRVAPGRVLAILGPSGAGKTALLDTISGFRSSESGEIHLDGRDITGLAPEHRRIGVVFQDAALFPNLTVLGNVGFGPRILGKADPAGVTDLLRRFGLTQLADRSPRSLSGGERQRVALARALAVGPSLLLLDEPLSALDQPTRESAQSALHDLLLDLDIPVVLVTHDRDEALTLADDLAVIVDGHLRQLGATDTVAACPADPDVAPLLGWAELGTGTVHRGQVALGALRLPTTDHPEDRDVRIFYRPEDVILAPVSHTDDPGRFSATIQEIVPTVPLLRVVLGPVPHLTALVHRRELHRLDLHVGGITDVELAPDAVRLWPASPS